MALDLTGLTKVTIRIDDKTNSDITNDTAINQFALIDNNGTAINEDSITQFTSVLDSIESSNRFSEWTLKTDNRSKIYLVKKNNALPAMEKILNTVKGRTEEDLTNLQSLFNGSTGDAASMANSLKTMTDSEINETLDHMFTSTTLSIEQVVAENTVPSVVIFYNRLVLGRNIIAENTQDINIASNEIETGISAGEEGIIYGAWLNTIFDRSTQKAQRGAPGYKATSLGVNVGFDSKVNDDLMLGAAFSLANSEIKHQDRKAGDKTMIESAMFTLYGTQLLAHNWFVQSIMTICSNNIRNSETRIIPGRMRENAVSKYNTMSFNEEILGGYTQLLRQVALSPMAGVRYSRVNDSGYQETGTTYQNLDITKKASNKFELILGAKVQTEPYHFAGFIITPEVHGFINHDLIAKGAKIDAKLSGASGPIILKTGKASRTLYNLGIEINLRTGLMDFGVGYDAMMSNKYTRHRGALKVRVNF